jgi:hypothetical protein
MSFYEEYLNHRQREEIQPQYYTCTESQTIPAYKITKKQTKNRKLLNRVKRRDALKQKERLIEIDKVINSYLGYR